MRRVSLGRLTRMFAWIGFTSVGGGRSAYIYEALVVRLAPGSPAQSSCRASP